MSDSYDRREILQLAGAAVLGGVLGGTGTGRADVQREIIPYGCVVGQPEGARAGNEVLDGGGNAVDAITAAALVAGVVAIQQCGIGGYGGHMVIALPGGKKVTAIDFNSAAPAAARPDMFPLDDKGAVKGKVNAHGWLAAGVPGTLAGIQLALDRHGTRPFSRLVQPAIRHARQGFPVSQKLAKVVHNNRALLGRDAGSARLLLPGGQPLRRGSTFRNPDLADLLQTLAERKSVESFYRGDIGRRIAAAFQKNGGLVTAADMAAYRAREVVPLELSWRGYSIYTAPLTAGGATILQALLVLKELGWDRWPAADPRTTHARLEALRIAWHDRLALLGDPEKVQVPLRRLLSAEYARSTAARVRAAVKQGRPVAAETDGRRGHGTVHLSAVDANGMMASMTLTHGEAFGARVTVDGLGLILGHGMSRFDPRPGRPNSPGPGKRPLHNMCPTVVLHGAEGDLALGAAGGRKIPNTIFDVLVNYVGRDLSLDKAIKAPRMHTEGGMDLILEASWPEKVVRSLTGMGYRVKKGPGARVSAVTQFNGSGIPWPAVR
jgi:gamma-glutamyltranspeptidase/glutathione hydrolase